MWRIDDVKDGTVRLRRRRFDERRTDGFVDWRVDGRFGNGWLDKERDTHRGRPARGRAIVPVALEVQRRVGAWRVVVEAVAGRGVEGGGGGESGRGSIGKGCSRLRAGGEERDGLGSGEGSGSRSGSVGRRRGRGRGRGNVVMLTVVVVAAPLGQSSLSWRDLGSGSGSGSGGLLELATAGGQVDTGQLGGACFDLGWRARSRSARGGTAAGGRARGGGSSMIGLALEDGDAVNDTAAASGGDGSAQVRAAQRRRFLGGGCGDDGVDGGQ